MVALAALRRLLSDAESGDLASHGETVTAESVEHWIAGHLPAALESLLAGLETASKVPVDVKSALAPKLAGLLAQKKMMTLEEAARSLEVALADVEEVARRDPRQFGILGGSVPALFQPATVPEAP